MNNLNTVNNLRNNLKKIHTKLIITGGNFDREVPEQLMALKYIKGNEKILEIGGNIGRNSLIISHLLQDSNNLVVLESNSEYCKILEKNKQLNNFDFNILNYALSKQKLYQHKWRTYTNTENLKKYFEVKTILFEEIEKKFNIKINTLVLDCEGAFYNILKDFPNILENINKIIIENDFKEIEEKKFVDEILKQNNFYVDFTMPLKKSKWRKNRPCNTNFYEVWLKNINY